LISGSLNARAPFQRHARPASLSYFHVEVDPDLNFDTDDKTTQQPVLFLIACRLGFADLPPAFNQAAGADRAEIGFENLRETLGSSKAAWSGRDKGLERLPHRGRELKKTLYGNDLPLTPWSPDATSLHTYSVLQLLTPLHIAEIISQKVQDHQAGKDAVEASPDQRAQRKTKISPTVREGFIFCRFGLILNFCCGHCSDGAINADCKTTLNSAFSRGSRRTTEKCRLDASCPVLAYGSE
jgi:hypothetical protein